MIDPATTPATFRFATDSGAAAIRTQLPAVTFHRVRPAQAWRVHFCEGYYMTLTDNGTSMESPMVPPTYFHRLMTRFLLGWRWERVK